MSTGTDTVTRVLRLLALLQARRFWSGGELADRLGVSARTLRRDVDRLRELGYGVSAERGPEGGYTLEPGSTLPPLVLDDDELVVLAVGLRAVTVGGVEDTGETAVSALAKLERVIPSHLRRRVLALQSHTVPHGPGEASAPVTGLVARLALACSDGERVRFGYTGADGTWNRYLVEPHRLVSADEGWYLVAHAPGGPNGWTAFRVARMDSFTATGSRFTPEEAEAERAEEIAYAEATTFGRSHVGLLRVHAPLAELREAAGPWAHEAWEESATTTLWPVSADHVQQLFYGLSWIPEGFDFEVVEPPELRDRVRAFGERLLRSVREPG
ncbi:WYL domain-containing protein [Nocardiopsis sp. HNM0947]|uniref:WYL domain-containing protein n=1 Tax=Nocardiopsis coralli TaxID=2772213 RepID=A0ABR9P244_9ACTN|nr:WYL domain-containing protein [Nocardiopsis coralli]MBE2997917.1 WYL domain-containing protein [Nocardiopsis coralli]